MIKDRTKYYRRILKRNKALRKAFEACIEELEKVPLFSDEKKELMAHYACTWAPVFTEFTTWVLRDANKRGVKKVYFLSRDAYPMYTIARILCEGNPDAPELHYLRISRYSIRIPEMLMRKGKFLDKIFLSGIDVTMRKILQRAALTDEEMKEVADIIGFDKPMDEILSRPEILRWKKRAVERKWEIWPYVQGHSRKLLPALLGYLRSEGMMSGDKIAIVDSGWVGSTQKSLLTILKYDKPDIDLEGYYFGLYELPRKVDKRKYHTFYFAPWRDVKKKVRFSNCLFEAVSSEAKGMTLRYEKWDDIEGKTHFEPVLAGGGSLNKGFLNDAEVVLNMYAKEYKNNEKYENRRRVSGRILMKLMAKPDRWEAREYGKLLFCDDVLENGAQTIAAKLSYEDICNLRLFRKTKIWFDSRMGKPSPTIHESGWIYGSIVNCGENVIFSLWEAKLYNWLMYVRKSLIRRN